MSHPGRPRVLDDVKRGQISALLSAGCGLGAAARFVGCSITTIRREALRNDAFRGELRSAAVRAQLKPLRAMQEAATRHWRAAAWLLERADPEQFDRRRNADYRPRQLQELVDSLVQFATEDVADERLRESICRRLITAAQQISRPLAAIDRARLQTEAEPFAPPKSADARSVDQLLAELQRNEISARRNLRRKNQNTPDCA